MADIRSVPTEKSRQDLRRAVGRYWDSHPIATDSVPYERGSLESFDALYDRWERAMNPRRLEFLERCRTGRVLEVGCGIAIDGRFLASHGVDYQAVDLSRASLRLARRHFELKGLPPRFTNADAPRLPFGDGTFDLVFSIGVLHHVPDMEGACREVERVTKSGGIVHVMFYHRNSYHYALVDRFIRPLVWLLLHVPGGGALARHLPSKLRDMYEISARHGFDRKRLLDISTDTSGAGEGDYNPHSAFVTEARLRELFSACEDHRFHKSDLKFFPVPFLRRFVEPRWGFFLTMTAKKK